MDDSPSSSFLFRLMTFLRVVPPALSVKLIPTLFANNNSVVNVILFPYFILIVTFGPILPFPLNYITMIAIFSFPILHRKALTKLVRKYFEKPDTITPIGTFSATNGELIAVIGGWGYYPVTICDYIKSDDAFWPDHASIIHFVEYRRHFPGVQIPTIYQLVVWRVSVFNGERKQLHKFTSFDDYPGWGCDNIKCFQSAGVIFVVVRYTDDRASLYVYDTRYQLSTKYTIPLERGFLSISCADRLWNENGFVEGWKIRLVSAECTWGPRREGHENEGNDEESGEESSDESSDEENENVTWRSRLVINYFDLNFLEGPSAIDRKEIDFGSNSYMDLKMIRNSSGLFVVFADNYPDLVEGPAKDLPAIVYDETTDAYVRCSTIKEAMRLDRSISMYFNKEELYDRWSCPIVLNEKENIAATYNGVRRFEFGPPTFKYLSTKTMFRSKSKLQNLPIADRFFENWERILGKKKMEPVFFIDKDDLFDTFCGFLAVIFLFLFFFG